MVWANAAGMVKERISYISAVGVCIRVLDKAFPNHVHDKLALNPLAKRELRWV